jgi:hypothetical protein
MNEEYHSFTNAENADCGRQYTAIKKLVRTSSMKFKRAMPFEILYSLLNLFPLVFYILKFFRAKIIQYSFHSTVTYLLLTSFLFPILAQIVCSYWTLQKIKTELDFIHVQYAYAKWFGTSEYICHILGV